MSKYKYRVYYDPGFDSGIGRFLRATGMVRSYDCDVIIYPVGQGGMWCLHRNDGAARRIPGIQIVRVDLAFGGNDDMEESIRLGDDLTDRNRGGPDVSVR